MLRAMSSSSRGSERNTGMPSAAMRSTARALPALGQAITRSGRKARSASRSIAASLPTLGSFFASGG